MSEDVHEYSDIAMRLERAKVVVRRMPDEELQALSLGARYSLFYHLLGVYPVLSDSDPEQVAEYFLDDLQSKAEFDTESAQAIAGMEAVNSFPVGITLPELIAVVEDEQRERAGIPLFAQSEDPDER